MKLQEILNLPLPPREAAAMYTDPAYPALRAETLHATSATSEVTGDPAGAFTVTTELLLPTEGVPDMVRRFVGREVRIRETQRWDVPDADGSRSGHTDLVVVGAPASMSADLALAPLGEDASTVTIDGDLVAKVPLLGRKIEEAAKPYVSKVLGAEQRSAQAYADRRG